ncbi:type II secretion system protein [Motilimonas pumila]|uniref:Type II secretion system protein n=1 Tax=Motilimonas pumila TaxID=2303987 RepID=A0A418YI23_9GAMM|nr:type II secretion system protein [Motilimonas pumila]RJG49979.1 type II secretion system protein [Motilimonas pumila]
MKQALNKQSGFTLIELVIVIIVLGILAATAAPKFIDLQTDARQSALNGLKAALEGGATLTYAKAAIAGKEKDATAADLDVDGRTVNIIFGYPTALNVGIGAAVDLSSGDWATTEVAAAGGEPAILQIAATGTTPETNGSCWVEYAETETATDRPVISIVGLDSTGADTTECP